jgi:hypothetical protein
VYQLTLSPDTTKPGQVAELTRLFRAALGPDVPPKLLDPAFLSWKFFQDRPWWPGSRSYVVTQDDAIAAHACVWPSAFHTPAGVITGCHLLDWAASPVAVGSGVSIYRDLIELADIAIAIGGSSQARRLLPKLGFRPYGFSRYFARVIRPLPQFRARPRASMSREIVRLGRNAVWTIPPLKPARAGWTAGHARSGRWLDDLVADPAGCPFSPAVRSSALVNYLLDCPAARCHLYAVYSQAEARGYFLLNEVNGQTRIIDLLVRSSEAADWETAYRLALRAAADLPETCEVVATSSLPWLDQILERCGMRERIAKPILVYDRRGLLSGAAPLHLQMVDSDAFFLYSPSFPFLT